MPSSPVTPAPALPSGWTFMLRQNWSDIGLLAKPTSVDKATGATASFSNDLVAANRTWAVDATAAVVYSSIDDQGPNQTTPFDRSLAAYALVNKAYNSNPKQASKNVDQVGGGGSVEVGFRNAAAENEQYFQLQVGGVTDNIKDTTTVNATAAWIPVSFKYNIHVGAQLFGDLGYRLDPEAVVQYASATGKSGPLLFSGRDEALRIGPQIKLIVFPFVTDDSFWSHWSASLTYHAWYEAMSQQEQYWLQPSVTYNFDQAGNFGLTWLYKRGSDENSGAFTNIYMVSFSGKY